MTKRKVAVENSVEVSFEEVNTVENFISEIIEEDNFYNLNSLLIPEETEKYSYFNADFITVNKDALTPYSNTISEKDFFRIVGVNKTGFSKRSGKYQESLYSHYIRAVAEDDCRLMAG